MKKKAKPIHLGTVREAHRMLDAVTKDLEDLSPAVARRAHRKLDQIARETPEVTAPKRSRGRPPKLDAAIQVAFRLPADLVDRIDGHARRMQVKAPSTIVTRADVVRMLLTRAIVEVEAERGSKPKRGR